LPIVTNKANEYANYCLVYVVEIKPWLFIKSLKVICKKLDPQETEDENKDNHEQKEVHDFFERQYYF
jgi:hypothetical protein